MVGSRDLFLPALVLIDLVLLVLLGFRASGRRPSLEGYALFNTALLSFFWLGFSLATSDIGGGSSPLAAILGGLAVAACALGAVVLSASRLRAGLAALLGLGLTLGLFFGAGIFFLAAAFLPLMIGAIVAGALALVRSRPSRPARSDTAPAL